MERCCSSCHWGSGSAGDGSGFYPVATVFPNFERLLARALAEDPLGSLSEHIRLREALTDLNLPVVLQSGHFTTGLIRE